jgi:hypothetical protein
MLPAVGPKCDRDARCTPSTVARDRSHARNCAPTTILAVRPLLWLFSLGCTIPPHRLADDELDSHNLNRGDEALGS